MITLFEQKIDRGQADDSEEFLTIQKMKGSAYGKEEGVALEATADESMARYEFLTIRYTGYTQWLGVGIEFPYTDAHRRVCQLSMGYSGYAH